MRLAMMILFFFFGFFMLLSFQDWFSFMIMTSLLVFNFLLLPYLQYKKISNLTQAKELIYSFDDHEFTYVCGYLKNTLQKESIISIAIYKNFLKIDFLKNSIKLYPIFDLVDRERITTWLQQSAYKNLLQLK